jgi:transcriptional regulator with XRE-family HTH domain
MRLLTHHADDILLGELGGRLAAVRLDRNLTQAELAATAGVSKRTVERLESGSVAIQLSGFLRVCRALGLLSSLDALVPEPEPIPLARLELAGRKRRRASRARSEAFSPTPWTWRDRP